MADSSSTEQPAVRTTIVGGRPPGCGKPVGNIPRGIEVLVKKAAVDPDFRATLLAKRAAAADEIGLTLAPAEIAMLNSVPAAQLEAIVGQTRVDPAVRPAFLGKVAAAMLLAIGVVSMATDDSSAQQSRGIQPDTPQPPTTQQARPVDIAGMTVGPIPPLEVQPMNGARVAPPIVRPPVADTPTTTPPTTQPTAEQIDALIAKLGDRDAIVRDAADKELRRLDQKAVIARLTALDRTKLSAEADERVKSLLDTPAEIERLIRQLEFQVVVRRGATAFHDTAPEEAAARLIEIGPWSLPPVKAAIESGKLSPDAKKLAQQVVDKLSAAAAPATQPASLAPGEFDKLIKQLDDRDFKVREAAENTLIAAGESTLPLLRKMLREHKGLLPEASWRIRRAISRLLDPPPATSQPVEQPASLPLAEFETLVKQLDDHDFKVREAAENKLVAAGGSILPLLRKTVRENKGLAPEASWRISRAINRLDPPPATPQPAKLNLNEFLAILKQLDDRDFKVREAAENKLVADDDILPLLQKTLLEATDLSPEASWRIARAISRLNQRPAATP